MTLPIDLHRPCSRLRSRRERGRPTQLALREKDCGIWHEMTWQRTTATAALLRIGARARWASAPATTSRSCSDNRPEWLLRRHGGADAGRAGLGIYPTNPWPDVAVHRSPLPDASSCSARTRSRSTRSRRRALRRACPVLPHRVFDMRGMRALRRTTADVVERASSLAGAAPARGRVRRWSISRSREREPARRRWSSTRQAPPACRKARCSLHRNMLSWAGRGRRESGLGRALLRRLATCRSATWPRQLLDLLMHLLTGCVVSFGEAVDTVRDEPARDRAARVPRRAADLGEDAATHHARSRTRPAAAHVFRPALAAARRSPAPSQRRQASVSATRAWRFLRSAWSTGAASSSGCAGPQRVLRRRAVSPGC